MTSERLNELAPEAEVFFYRLLVVADDWGRFHGQPAIVRAALFPLRLDGVSEKSVTEWLDQCAALGLVLRYKVNGKPLVQIADFRQRTRAKESKFPEPPTRARNDGQHDRPLDGQPAREVSDNMTDTPRTYSDSESHSHSHSRADTDEARPVGEDGAEIPTKAEVVEFGKGAAAVPEFYCERYHEKKSIARTWTSRLGRLVDWRRELIKWFAEDGRPTTKNEASKRAYKRGFDRNAGTANEGKASEYAGVGKL